MGVTKPQHEAELSEGRERTEAALDHILEELRALRAEMRALGGMVRERG